MNPLEAWLHKQAQLRGKGKHGFTLGGFGGGPPPAGFGSWLGWWAWWRANMQVRVTPPLPPPNVNPAIISLSSPGLSLPCGSNIMTVGNPKGPVEWKIQPSPSGSWKVNPSSGTGTTTGIKFTQNNHNPPTSENVVVTGTAGGLPVAAAQIPIALEALTIAVSTSTITIPSFDQTVVITGTPASCDTLAYSLRSDLVSVSPDGGSSPTTFSVQNAVLTAWSTTTIGFDCNYPYADVNPYKELTVNNTNACPLYTTHTPADVVVTGNLTDSAGNVYTPTGNMTPTASSSGGSWSMPAPSSTGGYQYRIENTTGGVSLSCVSDGVTGVNTWCNNFAAGASNAIALETFSNGTAKDNILYEGSLPLNWRPVGSMTLTQAANGIVGTITLS